MKKSWFSFFGGLVALAATSCSSSSQFAQLGDYRFTAFDQGNQIGEASIGNSDQTQNSLRNQFIVKTTAYTHREADHLKYGRKSAAGSELKYGKVRSAAADWSRFPLGTRFKINGLPYEYVVDDYGSALVGTDTIDLYKPSKAEMRHWGARNVGIKVTHWGSFAESMRILETRQHKAGHVRRMLSDIKRKIHKIPSHLHNGFRT